MKLVDFKNENKKRKKVESKPKAVRQMTKLATISYFVKLDIFLSSL